jgi:hypothetical protein
VELSILLFGLNDFNLFVLIIVNMPKKKKSNMSSKPLRQVRVLRNKDPNNTKSTKKKDGQTFKRGKAYATKPKPKSKASLVCRQIRGATVCFDSSKPKRSDGKKVKPRKKYKSKK